jgi:uncharacterized protein (UPF0276 family)
MAGVGVSYEAIDPACADHILPLIDFIEVIPDTLAVKQRGRSAIIPRDTLRYLADLAGQVHIIVHGVGLSIGSYSGWNDDYFSLLDQILDTVPVAWHSEHLGFVTVANQFVGTMLALPRTAEALDLVAERARRIIDTYRLPFLLEHTVNLLPDPPAEMSEAAFLNALAEASGCELLLDVYNLECNAHNQNDSIDDFLSEINFEAVREMHVAGGIERAGLMLDVHSRSTRPSTRHLLKSVFARAHRVEAVLYEVMAQARSALGPENLMAELQLLRATVDERCD